ncbi:thioredoxin family protein [Desertivirga arenae]|uniref:thioredoxin family protein n=1 Tax=Desertivirga arenae TaxID=2810309 RepID=UPI001A9652D0|nr:thioredoxin family protein [Pedobacter sp. SYSU D00823]
MNYQEYQQLFDKVLESRNPPYNDEMYFNYTKLNRSRMKRWDKQLQIKEELLDSIKAIEKPQHWIIITEPWCGDAAHIIPFLISLAEQSPLITYDLQLRDAEPYLINSYLTNGTKSIPKLIVRDENGTDIFNWGPRPAKAQELFDQLKANKADFEEMKIALQHWYNEDKGQSLMNELKEFYS